MRLKDPTDWVNDLTVFVDDEEMAETAALLEPDVLYRGSKAVAALWLSLVGMVAGGLAAVTLSPGIRSSIWAFAVYLLVAVIVFRGLRPATEKLTGRPIVWLARTTFFWAALLVCFSVLTARFDSAWLAYGLSLAGGFFVGMMQGSLNPNCIRNENAWMGVSLALGPACSAIGTALERGAVMEPGSVLTSAAIGVVAAALYSAPLSAALMRLWDEAHGCRQMAMLFLHNDNFAAKAISYLDHALTLRPDDADLYNLRGIAWSKMNEGRCAVVDWRKAAELKPGDSEPYMNIGVDHLRRGEIAEAIAALNTALERNAEDPIAHNNLGTAYEKQGNLDRAIVHYDRAIALRPDYPNAHSNRAYARFRKGDHRGAIADCDRALQLNSRLPAALVNRGHALMALRDYEAAAQSFDDAIEMDPSPEIRREALEGLEALAGARGRAELHTA